MFFGGEERADVASGSQQADTGLRRRVRLLPPLDRALAGSDRRSGGVPAVSDAGAARAAAERYAGGGGTGGAVRRAGWPGDPWRRGRLPRAGARAPVALAAGLLSAARRGGGLGAGLPLGSPPPGAALPAGPLAVRRHTAAPD